MSQEKQNRLPPNPTNIKLKLIEIDNDVNTKKTNEIQETTFKTYEEDHVKTLDFMKSDECISISKHLQELCEGSDLDYEFTMVSMFVNDFTSIIYRKTTNKDNGSTDEKLIGFVSYSIKDHLQKCIELFTINRIIPHLYYIAQKELKKPITFSNEYSCIVISVLIAVKNQGIGSLLIDFLKDKHDIFVKSIRSAYWFYMKQNCIPFFCDKSSYYELPYKQCYDATSGKSSHHTGYNKNAKNVGCDDKSAKFASWFEGHDLIPLILPCVPNQGGGGANVVQPLLEYIVVLGQRRKIVMKAKKKMVNVRGTLVSIRDAKAMESNSK